MTKIDNNGEDLKMHKLKDERMLMASYADIERFFSENSIIGKTIEDIVPYRYDYMIQNFGDIEDFINIRTRSAIDTDGHVCILFDDGSNFEIEFCGDGPVIMGYNTADFDSYPEFDGSCYKLSTLFQYCLGHTIVGIHFEKTDKKMCFPSYCGIDMSGEDDGIKEIRFALNGGTTLMASGSLDRFSFEHFMDFGGRVEVKVAELISELNEETYSNYFANWIHENVSKAYEEDKWERFSSIEIDYDDIDNLEYGQFGFKNAEGEIVIEPQYWCCGDFRHGLAAVAMKGPRYLASNGRKYNQELWGFIDKTGKAVIPFKFGQARDFNKYGVAVVQDEWNEYADYYLIDTNGKEIPGTRFRYIEKYYDYEDRFLEFSDVDPGADNNMGLYDTKERKVFIRPKKGSVMVLSEDCIKISETGEYGCCDTYDHFINFKGEELYPGLLNKGFGWVKEPNEDGHVIVSNHSFYQLDDNATSWNPIFGKKYRFKSKYGVADLGGNLLIPIEYDSVKDNKDGSFECQIGEEKRVISLSQHID